MRIEFLKDDRVKDFIDYCKLYRNDINDSCLGDEDLERFTNDEDNPTYVLLNDDNDIVGVVSLIVDKYHRAGKTGRLRIFHSSKGIEKAYKLMLQSILKHTEGLDNIYIFAKEEDENTREALKELNFRISGYSFDMIRDDIEVNEVSFPEGFELRSFEEGRDEEDWCEIRNIGFAGSEPPRTPDTVSAYWEEDEGHLDGGMMLLYHNDNPVGTVRASKEVEEGVPYTFVSVLCVKPEYRKRGLGRNLLRAAVKFGRSKGIPKGMLCVDPDNEKAIELYINEGFDKLNSNACFRLHLK